jgi:FkbM family methyltransferase
LRENVELIRRETGTTITVRDQAASDSDDSQVLYCPPGWRKNAGVSSLKEQEGGKEIEVQGVRLDSFVDEDIQVVKLDVEGAEADVLRGAQRALAQKRITHVIFEEHAPGSSDAVEILRSEGYSIYALDSHFVGPRLRGPLPERGWPDELYNFVATGQPEELQRVYRKNGWKCLRG